MARRWRRNTDFRCACGAGWYGMASVKWLNRIRVLAHPFDGHSRRQLSLRRSAKTPEFPFRHTRESMMVPRAFGLVHAASDGRGGAVELTGRACRRGLADQASRRRHRWNLGDARSICRKANMSGAAGALSGKQRARPRAGVRATMPTGDAALEPVEQRRLQQWVHRVPVTVSDGGNTASFALAAAARGRYVDYDVPMRQSQTVLDVVTSCSVISIRRVPTASPAASVWRRAHDGDGRPRWTAARMFESGGGRALKIGRGELPVIKDLAAICGSSSRNAGAKGRFAP